MNAPHKFQDECDWFEDEEELPPNLRLLGICILAPWLLIALGLKLAGVI